MKVVLAVLGILLLLLLLVGLPSNGMSQFSVVIPTPTAPPDLGQELARFAATHDWQDELTRAGSTLSPGQVETLTDDLALENADIDGRRLGYEIEWHTYPIPHAVCPEEIRDIADWLVRVVPEVAPERSPSSPP